MDKNRVRETKIIETKNLERNIQNKWVRIKDIKGKERRRKKERERKRERERERKKKKNRERK